MLGLIIEKVSGQSYFDYVRENIYAPAGMTSSDSYLQDAVVPNRATGYTSEDENEKRLSEPRTNIYALPGRGSSAGGGYSTAQDLLRFDLAMRAGKLLSPALDRLVLLRSHRAAVGTAACVGEAAETRRAGGARPEAPRA